MFKHRSYYSVRLLCTELYVFVRLLTTLAHTKSNTHTAFSLFVSSELGMCDRLNSLVCNPPFSTSQSGALNVWKQEQLAFTNWKCTLKSDVYLNSYKMCSLSWALSKSSGWALTYIILHNRYQKNEQVQCAVFHHASFFLSNFYRFFGRLKQVAWDNQ